MKHLWALAGFALTSIFLFICAILFQTLYHDGSALTFHDKDTYAWRTNDSTVFVYKREIISNTDFVATVHRRMMCYPPTSEGRLPMVLDLPTVERHYAKDYREVLSRVIEYPMILDTGTKCEMHTHIVWWPGFSMAAHEIVIPNLNFTVSETMPSGAIW